MSPRDFPQLQQPLSLQNRKRPLFVFFLPGICAKCVLRLHPQQPGGLGDGFSELAVLVSAELGGDGLGLLQGGEGLVGLTCDVQHLGFFAQELGVFFGLCFDLGLTSCEEGLGFVELVLFGEEEG